MMHFRLLPVLLLLLCSPASGAEIATQEALCLKKWGLSYCLSTFAHVKNLAPIAAEAAENYYSQCMEGKENKEKDAFREKIAAVRGYYTKHAEDYSGCKGGENCSFMTCVNITESMLFRDYIDLLY